MIKVFTAKELAVCALFGALIFLEGFVLGSLVISITGIPATGSLLNMFFALMILVVGVRLVPKFGTATVIATIEGILTVPTVVNGPPGIQKILMMFLLGLFFDIVLYLSGRSRKGFLIGGSIGAAGVIIFIYLELLLLGLSGLAQLQAVLVPLVIANFFLGVQGRTLAYGCLRASSRTEHS